MDVCVGRYVRGSHSRAAIGAIFEDGARVDCIAFAPWLVRETLEHIGNYWLGDFAPHSTPETAVFGWFT